MILTFEQLSEKLGLSKCVIDLYASRSELAKFDTTIATNKKGRNSRALICTKESMDIFYELASRKYYRNFTQRKFMNFYNKLEDK